MEYPIFLALRNVLRIHENQLRLYGGEPGIRDRGLLESAIAQPMAGIRDRFLHEDLHAMAAAYLFRLIQNHPFIDGNKRVGAMTSYAFLELNGAEPLVDDKEFETLCLGVAEGRVEKQQVAAFFRSAPRIEE